jgi:hypothetical protein
MKPRPDADLLPLLSRVAAALAAPGQPEPGFVALDHAFRETLGHKLFTILLFHADTGDSERFYTNQPEAYPVGGRKALNPTFWTRQVLEDQTPYLGRTYDDIRAVFFDHELIRSLGCEAVLNLPVVFDGRTLGTINLLHEAGWYQEADAVRGGAIASLAVPGLAMLQRAAAG